MPQPKFDNLADVTHKFVGTICYHKDQPVYVNAAFHGENDPKQFLLSIAEYGKESEIVDVHSPNFRYRDYKLGYCNTHTATWWYRRPARQYQQGLKADQVRFFNGNPHGTPKSNFSFIRPYVQMLRGDYMPIDSAFKTTRDAKMRIAAWHKDFAVSWAMDDMCYYLEYRGSRVGIMSADMKPHLFPEANYLKEALQEAMGR